MPIFASASFKGGTGKTTIALGIYNAFRKLGKKALLIDLDPNNNATDYYLRTIDPDEITRKNVYHALRGDIDLISAIYKTDNADIIPAAPILSRIGAENSGDPGLLLRFRAEIRKLDYEIVVIDTPPSLGIELRIALYAADTVITPIGLSRWTLQGFDILLEEIEKVQSAIGKKPISRAIPSMVSVSESSKLRNFISLPYLNVDIPRNNSIKNCATSGSSMKDGTIADLAFVALAKELLNE